MRYGNKLWVKLMKYSSLSIDVNKVNFGFIPGIEILKDINLNLCQNQVLSIVGASGCGKSTLLRLIAGLIQPTSGEIYLNNEFPVQLQNKRKIGIAFQDSCLVDWLSVEKNILLPTKLGKLSSDNFNNLTQRAHSIIDLVRLSQFKHYFPNQLSGGMKQRVSFARALINEPDILLLDEPFSALDSITKIRLMIDFSKILAERNLTTVFITHDIEEAVFLSDKIIFLSQSPATIVKELEVGITQPRNFDTYNIAEFEDNMKLCRKILMTNAV